ncbi:hypothetical protein RYX36_029234, partial [Vicia faba]
IQLRIIHLKSSVIGDFIHAEATPLTIGKSIQMLVKLEQPPIDYFEVCCVESGFGKNVSVGSVTTPPSTIPIVAITISVLILASR